MDYPMFIVSNQKEESISIQWVNIQTNCVNLDQTAPWQLLPSSVTFKIVWDQIRPNQMLGRIWIETVRHPDGIPESFFELR